MVAALEVTGNPSSVHRRRPRRAASGRDGARAGRGPGRRDARARWCSPRAAPRPTRWRSSPALGDTLLVSAIEHPSVRSGGRFAAVEEVAGDGRGRRRSRGAGAACWQGRSRPLVSLMLANNETGVIQPVAEAAALVHAAGGLLHVDAVQAPGRIACDIKALGADLMTLSRTRSAARRASARWSQRDGLPLDAADQGRRPGARRPRPAPRMWPASRLRRGRRGGPAGLAGGGRADGGAAGPARGRRSRSMAPKARDFRRRAASGCPTPRCFRSRASRPKRR